MVSSRIEHLGFRVSLFNEGLGLAFRVPRGLTHYQAGG